MLERVLPVRVLIVDDSSFVRRVIWHALIAAFGFEVVGTASDGLEALEAIMRLQPDVVTLDWNMPVCDGGQVLETLRGCVKKPKVVVVTANEASRESMVALGADDVVRKAGDTMSLDELIDAVRRASGAVSSPA
jgi:two-component system, chemotaxis family, protein-glutamate methylesterase/glutaminase